MSLTLRVLLVEDSEEDARLAVRELERAGLTVVARRIDTASALVSALQEAWDVVLADYRLPALDALETLASVRRSGQDAPVIVISGTVGEEAAVEALRAGAVDFIVKDRLGRLAPAVLRAIRERQVRIDQVRAEARARESEDRYRLLFESCPLPMWVYDVQTLRFLEVNEAAVQHYGYSREAFARMTLEDIRPREDIAAFREDVARAAQSGGRSLGRIWRHRHRDGSELRVEIKACDFLFEYRPARLVLVNDVTERQQLEEQLQHAHKMEAIGRLAGGVAHDFNNLLSVILSYSDLALDGLSKDDPVREDLDEVRRAGRRAAELTRQLLAFGRRQPLQPRALELDRVVLGMQRMLERLLGDDIEVSIHTPKRCGPVLADPSQVEQVVMNLAINARDAMPQGGKLTLETTEVVLDASYAARHAEVAPGRYVMLAVTDNGMGMDAATRSCVFEPFFTTKEQGKGTGLGLATVFGIVKQSKGHIGVYSELGMGTTFKVYLPRVDAPSDRIAPSVVPPTLRGSETVLVVEDQDQVRAVVGRVLRRQGYRVLEARNGDEALRVSAQSSEPIDLLLTDVVMPGVSGPELARRLAPLRPEMRVLFASGFPEGAIVHQGVLSAAVAFLQKPASPEDLARKVREVLDG